jgi:hypothetical protein
MTTFDRQACMRLPLADAVLRLLHYATDDATLDRIFRDHRGRSYESTISFATLFHLLRDSILGPNDSAHQRFLDAQETGQLETTIEAVYGKLRRVPIALSQGLLAEATRRLFEVTSDAVDPLPKSLQKFEVLAFDGKKIKHVPKRLKSLRDIWGRLVGSKLLVVQDVATRMAIAFETDADGEAGDNGLVAGAVAQVRSLRPSNQRLWIGDRLFCDLTQIPLLSEGGEYYLLRYQKKVSFQQDPQRKPRTGKTADKLTYREEWGWFGSEKDKRRQMVRRIHLERPNEETIVLVTNLLDADAFPATDLLTAYRRRWGIETMFHEVTMVFQLRHLIGTTPQAMTFQAAIVLLVSNVIRIARGYVAEAEQLNPETISTKLFFKAVVKQWIAWHMFLDLNQTCEWLGAQTPTAAELKEDLRKRLANIWTDLWKKAKTVKRAPKPKRTHYLKGGHTSVDRVLRGVHKTVPVKKQ